MTRNSLVLMAFAVLVSGCDGGGGGGPDARPIEREDRDYVLSRQILPVTGDEALDAAFVLPGSDEPVNSLGFLIVTLLDLLEGVPVQADLDANLQMGMSLQVARIHSTAPDLDDPGAEMSFADVVDADEPADPGNDFGGSGQFRLAGGAALEPYGDVTLDDSVLEGGGDEETMVTFGLPLLPGGPVTRVTVNLPQIRVEMTEDGCQGAVGGAITEAVLHGDVYPPIATLMTRAITEQTPSAGTIMTLFDANGDSVVTSAELVASQTLISLTRPDVDVDGDTVGDYLSVAIHIEAVRGELLP